MKTKIILTIVGTAIFFGGELFAQRMPQDSWYLHKEFRGDIEGGKFNGVRHASSDTSGNIYVADDANHQVQVFDGNGNFLRKWGGYGTSVGKFARPHGIHVSSANKVYVAEYDGDRVQMFDTQGNYLKTFGRGGSGDGQMNGGPGCDHGFRWECLCCRCRSTSDHGFFIQRIIFAAVGQ